MSIRTLICTVLVSSLCFSQQVFAAAEAEKEVLKKEAASPEVLTALKEFKASAYKIASENGVTDFEPLKKDVVAYYTDQFGKEYEKKNAGSKYPMLATHIGGLEPEQIIAQYYYIAKNSNPLGSKHLLDKADDKSTYSQAHGKHHPRLRALLEENGLYDIFLVDPATGRIVYTVYKELDFFGDHLKGPNAASGLGEVTKKALAAKKGEIVESTVGKYGFSYDVLALFVGTPIFDGDKLEGVLIYQVNP